MRFVCLVEKADADYNFNCPSRMKPMKRWRQRLLVSCGAVVFACVLAVGGTPAKPPERAAEPILLVVMDPLAKELACACVKGYGQRDYRKLAARLQTALKEPVQIGFSDDLADTLALAEARQRVIVVGEPSLVAQGAKQAQLPCRPVCELTGLDGSNSVTGLFVVRKDDPANGLADLAGRKVLLGMVEADAKHAAARAALHAAKLEPPAQTESRSPGSAAALDVLDSSASPLPVAVIPSYALPLLEACGSIRPGDLRVIGRTEPVPFIAVFLSDSLKGAPEQKILKALLDIKTDSKLLKAMESRDGFKPLKPAASTAAPGAASTDWPDWRGPARDGHVHRLPARLPERATLVWKKAAMNGGLAGLSVSASRLILAERDFGDEHDVYRCLDADNGELIWRKEFSARGTLDYGQFPRATPVIHAGRAYLLGAFGGLRCVSLSDGELLWERHLPREFKAELPTWGMCATPLVVDDLLIVNPGAPDASLVALDLLTGRTRWMTPGGPAAYASFICGEFGGHRQIVGYDQRSLGGWDVKTGQRLWRLVPPSEGDFNVPTPVAVEGAILISTENNGTRLHRFDDSGRIISRPAAQFPDLAPDTVTPVVAGGRVFGAHLGLCCLDVQKALQPVWRHKDDALGDYATLIADEARVLVITLRGELLLLDAKANECVIRSRLRVFEEDVEVYSHPALVGARLYLRGGSRVVCLDLGSDAVAAVQ